MEFGLEKDMKEKFEDLENNQKIIVGRISELENKITSSLPRISNPSNPHNVKMELRSSEEG